MSEHLKSTAYETVRCSGCPNLISRRPGVRNPMCVDCKRKHANDRWNSRKDVYRKRK
jgi:hypothetical protein